MGEGTSYFASLGVSDGGFRRIFLTLDVLANVPGLASVAPSYAINLKVRHRA